MRRKLTLTVNGRQRVVYAEEDAMLLDLLRNDLGLTGTKKGCGKGECGACTVIMDGMAVNSCMIPAAKAEGKSIRTVEGLARAEKLSVLQEEFVNHSAVQCGFCTPGMLMSAQALLDKNNDPSPEQVKEAISGNICRCTGYVKIERAILAAARRLREEGGR